MSLAARTPTTASQTSGTGFSIAAPSGLSAGDTIIIFSAALSGTIGPLSGFTDSGETVTSAFHARGFMRIADGTEGSTFAITSAGTPGAAVCMAYSGGFGPDPAAPPAFVSASSSSSLPVPGVTLASSGDWLVWFGAAMRNANATPGTVSPPAGFTAQANTGPVASGSESCYLLGADLQSAQAAGPTGTLTGTTSLSVPRGGFLVGIRAAPATGSGGFMMSAQF